MKRLILDKIPAGGIRSVVGVTYDGVLDIITEDLPPADALYVAEQDEAGATIVLKDLTAGKNLSPHTFAGWDTTADSKLTKP